MFASLCSRVLTPRFSRGILPGMAVVPDRSSPNRARLERYEFGLAFGLFGAGSMARFVADSIPLALSSLFVARTRRGCERSAD